MTEREKKAKFKKVYEAIIQDIDEGKLLKTSFGSTYYYYDYATGASDENYPLYNDFSFTLYNNKTSYFSDEDTYWEYNWTTNNQAFEKDIYVELTRNCTHTLEALKAEGFYTDDDQLLTYAEYNQMLGYDDTYYY